MNIIWYTILIRAIPEAIGEILVTLAVGNEKRTLGQILYVGALCGLTAFLLRMMPLKFGISSLIVIVVQVFIMNVVLRIQIRKLFQGLLISLVLITLVEILSVAFIQYVLKLNLQAVLSTGLGTILAGLPSLIILYISAFAIFKLKNRRDIHKGVVNNVN